MTACFGPQNNDHKNHVYANDFESLFGVFPNVLKGKSHSGDCYFQVSDQIEYTTGFSQFFENISPNSFAKVKASASAKSGENPRRSLICAFSSSLNLPFWKV